MNLPNKLTLGRIIAVPIFIIAYLTKLYILALIIFILASLTDLLDGRIARSQNLITNFGKIMDPLADKILVYSAFCLFVADGTIPVWTLIIILAREFLVSGIRTVAASEGVVIAADMSGKIKTVLQMVAVPLLILYNALTSERYGFYEGVREWAIASPVGVLAKIVFWASIIMTVYSGMEYILKNRAFFRQ